MRIETIEDCWRLDYRIKLLVCLRCGHAINPRRAEEHLTKEHRDQYDKAQAQSAASLIPNDVQDRFLTANDTEALDLVYSSHLPPYLTSYRGYACDHPGCDYVSPVYDTVRRHLSIHDECTERSIKVRDGIWVSTVFKKPARWTSVSSAFISLSSGNIARWEGGRIDLHTLSYDWHEWQQRKARDRSIIPVDVDPFLTLWLKYTRWPYMFQGLDMRRLQQRFEEPTLAYSHAISQQCLQLLRTSFFNASQASHYMRALMRRIGGESWNEPLKTLEAATVSRYQSSWVRFIIFLSEASADSESLGIYLSSEQLRLLRRLHDSASKLHEILYPTLTDYPASPAVMIGEHLGIAAYPSSSTASGFNEALLPPEKERRDAELDVQRSILDLSLSLITHDLPQTETIRIPLLFFIGIIGWHKEHFGWRTASDIRPTLSAFIYVMRTLHYQALALDGNLVSEYPANASTYALVQKSHLWQDSNTPFAEVFNLSIAAKNRFGDGDKAPNMSYDNSRGVLQYNELEIDVLEFFSIAGKELGVLEKLVLQLAVRDRTLLEERRPDKMRDPPSHRTTGECFADWEVNKTRDGAERVARWHCAADSTAAGYRVWQSDGNGQPEIVWSKVQEWLDAFDAAVQSLVFLVYLLAPGARGTELAEVNLRNDAVHFRRGVFIYQGLVVVMPTYNKTDNLTERSKFTPRFVPYWLSTLIVIFAADLLPFAERMRFALRLQSSEDTSEFELSNKFLQYQGRDITSSEISSILKDRFRHYLGHEIGIRDARQIFTRLHVEFVHPKLEGVIARFRDLEAQHAATSGHAIGTEQAQYAVDAEQFHLKADSFLQPIRQIFCGWHACFTPDLHRQYTERVRPCEHKGISALRKRVADSIASPSLSLQGRHGSKKPKPSSERSSFDAGHQEEEAPAAEELESESARTDSCGDAEADGRGPSSLAQTAQQKLELLYGKGARFRPGQLEAILAVLETDCEDVVVKLPTGSGKTDVISIPILMSKGTVSIVITPLVAARDDVMRRLSRQDVKNVEFNAMFGEMDVVFATPRAASTPEFSVRLAELRRSGSLFRVFVDECHMFSKQNLWRSDIETCIARLRAWRDGGIDGGLARLPRVFLSGTLPPYVRSDLALGMGIGGGATLVSQPTCRRDISLSAAHFADDEAIERHLVGLLRGQHTARQRTAVFCGAKEDAKKLLQSLTAQGFPAVGYWAGDMDRGQRSAAVEEVEGCAQSVIVATSALGLGVDIANLTLVVIYKQAHSVLDMAQWIGRAGRRGETARAVLLWRSAGRSGKPCGNELRRLSSDKRVQAFATTHGCRTSALSEALDDDPAVICREDRLCDNCEAKAQAGTPPAPTRGQQGPELGYIERMSPTRPLRTLASSPPTLLSVPLPTAITASRTSALDRRVAAQLPTSPVVNHARNPNPLIPTPRVVVPDSMSSPLGSSRLHTQTSTKPSSTPPSSSGASGASGAASKRRDWSFQLRDAIVDRVSKLEKDLEALGSYCVYCHVRGQRGSCDDAASDGASAPRSLEHAWKQCRFLGEGLPPAEIESQVRTFNAPVRKAFDYNFPGGKTDPPICWTCWLPLRAHGRVQGAGCRFRGLVPVIICAASRTPRFSRRFDEAGMPTELSWTGRGWDDATMDALTERHCSPAAAPLQYVELLAAILEEL